MRACWLVPAAAAAAAAAAATAAVVTATAVTAVVGAPVSRQFTDPRQTRCSRPYQHRAVYSWGPCGLMHANAQQSEWDL